MEWRNSNFVFKLFLKNLEESKSNPNLEYRRVRLSQLVGAADTLPSSNTFRELSKRSETLFPPPPPGEGKGKLRLSYHDDEGDWIVIGSLEELDDAIRTTTGYRNSLAIGVEWIHPESKKVGRKAAQLPPLKTNNSFREGCLETYDWRAVLAQEWQWIVIVIKALIAVSFILSGIALVVAFVCFLVKDAAFLISPENDLDLTEPTIQMNTGCFCKVPLDNPKQRLPMAPGISIASVKKKRNIERQQHTQQGKRSQRKRSNEQTKLKDIFDGILEGEDHYSPLRKAFEWVRNDHWEGYSTDRILQRFGLVAFYYATSGEETWKERDNWLSHQIHECSWWPGNQPNMSICGDDKYGPGDGWKYQLLWLPKNGLEGSFPPKLFNYVPMLRQIRLDGNIWLTGTLPTEIGQLSNLEELWLHQNMFQGVLPTELGQLRNLKKLCLAENGFHGTISASVFEGFSALKKLWLSHNKFSGTVPSEITIASFVKLHLSHNQWTGGLSPTLLPSLTNLRELSAPMQVAATPSELLIPTEVGLLTNLRQLDMFVSGETWRSLSSHKWERSEVASLVNLEHIRVGYEASGEDPIDIIYV